MAQAKPFRALRYDRERAGPLATVVAPPHDVVDPDFKARLLEASPYNVIRLTRPDDDPEEAGRLFHSWRDEGVLVREREPAVWTLEEMYTGPDGEHRTRRGLVARVRMSRYGEGDVYPHERTFRRQKHQRLDLLRATRTKLSPIFFLHEGDSPAPREGAPDLEVEFGGVRTRLWRIFEPPEAETALAAVRGNLIIADGHHRYETALRFHEENGTEETAFVLGVLVAHDDPGLEIFPTHRLAGPPLPELNGRFRLTEVAGAAEGLARLGDVPRDRPAFVLLRPEGAVLAETEPVADGPAGRLDTAVLDELELDDVRFTPSAEQAELAVAVGDAAAAFLVRAPSVEQVEAVALAGQTMPQKSTYFFPKLTSGLLFAPFDE